MRSVRSSFFVDMQDDESEGLEGRGGEESKLQRSSRSLNEKKRRDRFNILLQQLAGIVLPENERKLDKTTVLEHAINFLRNHQSYIRSTPPANQHASSGNWQPSFVTDGEFNFILLEASDSFTLAIDSNLNIIFASHSVLPLLGYRPNKIKGTNLLDYLHEDDAWRILPRLKSVPNKTTVRSDKNSLQFRMKCGSFYSKNSYQVVDCKATVTCHPNTNQEEQNCIVIVGNVQHPQANRIVVTSDSEYKEFSYRLTMDWKYVYLDHRASSIIGFLPFEVLGTSVYDYCGPEELLNVAQYHKILISLGKVTTCYYRHLTKGHTWVWLQSNCYISYNQWNSKPESITCTATVVHFDEVCANQTKIIHRDKEHFNKILARSESKNDSVSLTSSWPASPILCTPDQPVEQQNNFQQRRDDVATSCEQTKNSKTIFSPYFLNRLIQTPSDQLMDILESQSDVEMDNSEEEESNELDWLQSIQIPTGLTSEQLTTHANLLQEYKKIAEQIKRQERQLKMIRKLIDWSSLLLEFGNNCAVTGESSIDSRSISSSNGS